MPRNTSTLSPAVRKLREAVTEFSGKTGVNAATICAVTENFIGLLTARFDHICDVAMAEENNGQVAIGFRVGFDMTRKTPTGTVTLSFAQRTKDETEFQVDDPDQTVLPLDPAAAIPTPGRAQSQSSNSPQSPTQVAPASTPSAQALPSEPSAPRRSRRRGAATQAAGAHPANGGPF